MGIVIMDGTQGENNIQQAFCQALENLGQEGTYFKLEEFNIKPCRNCGGCAYKTPGECVFEDDMPKILPAVEKATRCIWVTPITLGGYNAITKKALDKFILIGIPTMIVYKGRLQHPVSDFDTSDRVFISIGVVNEKTTPKEKESFEFLIKENGLITCSVGHAFFAQEIEDGKELIDTLSKAITIGGRIK